MPRPMAQASLQRDRMLRWLYYRPYVKYGMLFLTLVLVIGTLVTLGNRRMDTEWKGVSAQQGVATCVRSYPMSNEINYWCMNTYLIEGKEQTVKRSECCVVGQEYRLHYRTGNTGRVEVGSRTELISPGKK